MTYRAIEIVIRPAAMSEYGRIETFLKFTPSKFVRARTKNEIERALSRGMVFIAHANGVQPCERSVVGVSVAYPRPDLSEDTEPQVFEVGSSLISPNFRGAAIHPTFHAVRVCQILHAHTDAEIITIIAEDNKKSNKNATANGFVLLSEGHRLFSRIPKGENKNCYVFDRSKAPSLAQQLLEGDIFVEGKFLHGKSTKTFHIIVDSPLLLNPEAKRDLMLLADQES